MDDDDEDAAADKGVGKGGQSKAVYDASIQGGETEEPFLWQKIG